MSRRHPDYPFAITCYINGLIDSRISTCCEMKHQLGVPLGGPRGSFMIEHIQRGKLCRQSVLPVVIDRDYRRSFLRLDANFNNLFKPTPIHIPMKKKKRRKQKRKRKKVFIEIRMSDRWE